MKKKQIKESFLSEKFDQSSHQDEHSFVFQKGVNTKQHRNFELIFDTKPFHLMVPRISTRIFFMYLHFEEYLFPVFGVFNDTFLNKRKKCMGWSLWSLYIVYKTFFILKIHKIF